MKLIELVAERMPWWFWLSFLCIASVGAVYLARRIAPAPPVRQEAAPAGPVFSPDGPDAFLADMPEDRTRCPFCLDKPLPLPLTGKELAGYTAFWENLPALLAVEKYDKALALLDKFVSVAPLEDHLRLLAAVYDVFEGLCENLTPEEVLALYDRLVAAGGAVAFALAHDQGDELAMILGYSFSRYPRVQTEQELGSMMDFLRQGHPLLTALQRQDPQSITDAINTQAANVFGGWEELTGPPSRAMSRVYAWLGRKI